MLNSQSLTVNENDLRDALNLSEGKKCHSLGEVFDFVTRLVADPAVLGQLDPIKLREEKDERPSNEPYRWWFRGVQTNHRLDAKLFRLKPDCVKYPTKTEDYGHLEERIRHEYSLMTRGRFPHLSNDPWDRLFEMQHYGLPTRLLDWTFSLGHALWFALNDLKDQPDHPSVWILNPRLLAKATLGPPHLDDFVYHERQGTIEGRIAWKRKPRSSLKPGKLLDFFSASTGLHFPVLASWTNPRISAQMGCFTLQGGTKSKPPSLDEYAKSAETRFLLKVCLEADKKQLKRWYEVLGMIGFNRYAVYPEMHETTAWIKELRGL